MKYIKKFENHAAYETAESGLILPNVSLITEENVVKYNPYTLPHDYLAFTATESGTFKFSGNNINYSLDDGETWTELASDTDSPTVSAGDKIMWKASLTPQKYDGIGTFSSTGNFTAEGNPMSLLYGDNFVGQTSLSGKDYAFCKLFQGCSKLTDAGNLSLPATTLAAYCYYFMFDSCTNLTVVPSLPATTLAAYCYCQMFFGCTSLTTVPELPATTLADGCYSNMFRGCTSLRTVDSDMLPATTLANSCYYCMFRSCTNLTTAPELPATTLVKSCYYQMFQDCTNLTTAPKLPATTLAESCYNSMFYGCTNLITAPELSAATLVKNCYFEMFRGCEKLSSITCLATDLRPVGEYCTYNWVLRVSSSGTFTKAASMTSWETGIDGIPENWTVVDAS